MKRTEKQKAQLLLDVLDTTAKVQSIIQSHREIASPEKPLKYFWRTGGSGSILIFANGDHVDTVSGDWAFAPDEIGCDSNIAAMLFGDLLSEIDEPTTHYEYSENFSDFDFDFDFVFDDKSKSISQRLDEHVGRS